MSPADQSRLLFSVMFLFSELGCATTPNLSVQLVHPKTKAVRTCAARESATKDVPMLSEAVEACARQLEARGFVRVGQPLTSSEQSSATDEP